MEKTKKEEQFEFKIENVSEDSLWINLYNTVNITMKALSLMGQHGGSNKVQKD